MTQTKEKNKPNLDNLTSKGTCVVHLLLDSTGSMLNNKAATMEAFNGYIKGLQASDHANQFKFTFSTFNSVNGITNVVSKSLIKDVPQLNDRNYQPDGATPLYDAIGRTIHEAEKEEGDAVLIIIQTDGEENASQEYTKDGVKTLIKEKTDNQGWQFVFLGCDIDAMAAAKSYGIDIGNTYNYTGETVRVMASHLSSQVDSYMAGEMVASTSFTGKSGGVDMTDPNGVGELVGDINRVYVEPILTITTPIDPNFTIDTDYTIDLDSKNPPKTKKAYDRKHKEKPKKKSMPVTWKNASSWKEDQGI